ncbi:hypothetical protein TWF694_006279 [Orbilia ellipsospora]|uniref:Peptide hydrolase n=1 Tax=Orbilia ellipsospora TaxID=2528407 RepID=A0AAV9XJN5_9PEZI
MKFTYFSVAINVGSLLHTALALPTHKNCNDGSIDLDSMVSTGRMQARLGALSAIATLNHGSRAFGTAGATESKDFILSQLFSSEYTTTTQDFTHGAYNYVTSDFTIGADHYHIFKLSVPLSVQGVSTSIVKGPAGSDPCEHINVESDPTQPILLVERNHCDLSQPLIRAAALLIYSESFIPWTDLTAPDPQPQPPYIAVGYLNRVAGLKIAHLIDTHQSTNTEIVTVITDYTYPGKNIIVESRHGDPDKVIVIGASYDTSLTVHSPGINDNGSGVVLILELFDIFMNLYPQNRLRFVFFGDFSDEGGSTAYVSNLSSAEKDKIFMYLHFTAVGKGSYAILDGDGSSPDSYQGTPPAGSATIETVFRAEYSSRGITTIEAPAIDLGDYWQFWQGAGKPIGGYFGITVDDATLALSYPCDYAACDVIQNIDWGMMTTNAQAAAKVVCELANRSSL